MKLKNKVIYFTVILLIILIFISLLKADLTNKSLPIEPSPNPDILILNQEIQKMIDLTNNQDFTAVYDEYLLPQYKERQNKYIYPLVQQDAMTRDYYRVYYADTIENFFNSRKIEKINVKINNISVENEHARVNRTLTLCADNGCSKAATETATIAWTKVDNHWYTTQELPLCWREKPFDTSSVSETDQQLDAETSVTIKWALECDMFPIYMYDEPIAVLAQPLSPDEKDRTIEVVITAFKKYPAHLIKDHLKYLYLLKNLTVSHLTYGGTYTYDTIYLTNDGIAMGYTPEFIEQEFHHEFSSILLTHMSEFYNKAHNVWYDPEWQKFNSSLFRYGKGGPDALRNNKTGRDFEPVLLRQGLIDEYAKSDQENDFNEMAMNLFKANPAFWTAVDNYSRIRKKVDFIIKFYQSLDPIFTEDYFRKISME